jgi:tRNA 2-thiouridine synthesizing protein A
MPAGAVTARACLWQTEKQMNFDKEFDASGLACPLPIVKTKKALADMASGQVLRVISTDPGSVADMAAFAEQTGNRLLEQADENKKFIFFLRKA